MALKDILLHVDNTQHCSARLDLAIGLALRFRSRLTGLFVISHPHYSSGDADAERQAAQARELFAAKTKEAGVQAEWLCVDWPVSGVSATEVINRHVYDKDLVIVGQGAPAPQGSPFPEDLPVGVIMGAGRPVLIVPYAGTFPTIGQRVALAWKSGRESVRALNDAFSLLKEAELVSVLEVQGTGAEDGHDPGSAERLCAHLERHGIAAKGSRLVAAEIPVGDLLLNQAWEQGCDLLVMGAFTRNAQGKLSLGTVAKHVLSHMTLPVLMAH